MHRQNYEILQFNKQQAQLQQDKKNLEKAKQKEEEKKYLDKVQNELNLERNSKMMKKQAVMDQSQRDYINYLNNKQLESNQDGQGYKLRNSKLKEINTFKIGSDSRGEFKRKNYQDYNDNLNLNITKNQQGPKGQLNEMNILNGVSDKDQMYQKQREQYNVINYSSIPNQNENSIHNEQFINNTTPQQHAYPNEQYKSESVSQKKEPTYQVKKSGKKADINSIPIPEYVKNVDDYEKYLFSIGINPLTLEYIENDESHKEHEQQSNNMQKQKVDLNSIPIPEYVRTTEDYEKYLISIGINPITLEYLDIQHVQPQQQDSNEREIYDKMNNLSIHQEQSNSHSYQQPNNEYNQSKALPNYGTRPAYKNQSQIFIADASAYQKDKQMEQKRDYEPFVKSKQLVVNPCK